MTITPPAALGAFLVLAPEETTTSPPLTASAEPPARDNVPADPMAVPTESTTSPDLPDPVAPVPKIRPPVLPEAAMPVFTLTVPL
jgi:hypothetical protein